MYSIVIPYRPEYNLPEVNGGELKYALRSFEKNLTGFGEVFIITDQTGLLPLWLTNVIIIPEKDFDNRKEFSCYNKLLRACEDERVTDDFLYANDDHFLLKPLDVSEIKNWYSGYLKEEANKRGHTARWRAAALNTLEILPEVKNYDIHRPVIFDKKYFKRVFQHEIKEVCIKSMYCGGFGGEETEDCDLSSGLTYDEIKQAIEGKLFCSSKGGITKEYFRVLQELFPEPSRFEL